MEFAVRQMLTPTVSRRFYHAVEAMPAQRGSTTQVDIICLRKSSQNRAGSTQMSLDKLF